MVDSNKDYEDCGVMEEKSDTYIFTIYTEERVLVSFDKPVTEVEALVLFKANEHSEIQLEAESIVGNVVSFEDAFMERVLHFEQDKIIEGELNGH